MYALTPHTLVLAGHLGAAEISSLLAYCRRLHTCGQVGLCIDMTGVSDCHRAGLDGLCALTEGASGLDVTLAGARWGQFTVLLREAPPADVERLREDVRILCGVT